MTGNDFREDGWQDTKMRKLGFWVGWVEVLLPASYPRRQKPGRIRDN